MSREMLASFGDKVVGESFLVACEKMIAPIKSTARPAVNFQLWRAFIEGDFVARADFWPDFPSGLLARPDAAISSAPQLPHADAAAGLLSPHSGQT